MVNSQPIWNKSFGLKSFSIKKQPSYYTSSNFSLLKLHLALKKRFIYATNNSNQSVYNLWENVWNKFKEEPKKDVFLKTEGKEFRFSMEAYLLRSIDCLYYIKAGGSKSVALFLDRLTTPLMCVDIDNPQIGDRILQLYNNQFTNLSFQEIFENPLMIQTLTPGHLHLYYKVPQILLKNSANKGKKSICNRLGFKVEHIFKICSFSQLSRTPIHIPNSLDNISYLPDILYPYNWSKRGNQCEDFDDNIKCSRTGKYRSSNGFLIPEGRRHYTMWEWCCLCNFSEAHVRAIAYLTCENSHNIKDSEIKGKVDVAKRRKDFAVETQIPEWSKYEDYSDSPKIQDEEVKSKNGDLKEFFNKTVDNTFYDKKDEPKPSEEPFKNDEKNTSYRLKKNEPPPKSKHETLLEMGFYNSKKEISLFQNLKFNPDRAKKALMFHVTSMHVLQAVAVLELREDIFFNDNEWMGKSLETVLLNCLIRFNKLDILVIEEKKWFLWDSKIWNQVDDSTILVYVHKQLKSLELGGFEKSVNRADYLKGLKNLVNRPFWPTSLTGITFNNGTLTFNLNKKESLLVPHQKEHFIRSKWDFDYNPEACLSPLTIRFILDTCGHDIYNINAFRLLMYNIIFQGHSQFGAFFQGDAGGSKSSFMRFLQQLNPQNTSTLDPSSFSRNKFQIFDLVVGKSLLFIPDVSPKSIKNETTEFLKTLLGRDTMFAEQKRGIFLNFKSAASIIIVSNFMYNEIPEFRDPAMYQRLIQFTFPSIKSAHKVSNIDNLLLENPSGFFKWIINIDPTFVKNTIRANEINDVISIITNPVDLFFQSKVSALENEYITNQTLFEEYTLFCEHNTLFKENVENYNVSSVSLRSFLKSFDYILSQYNDIIIYKSKKKANRGYSNMIILKDNETKDQFIENKNITKKTNNAVQFLEKNPWVYHGDLFYSLKDQFVQILNSNNVYEQTATITCYLVYNNSVFNILNPNAIKQKIPFDHLYLPISNGIKVHTLFDWDISKIPTWTYSFNVKDSLSLESDIIKNVLKNEHFKAPFKDQTIEIIDVDSVQENNNNLKQNQSSIENNTMFPLENVNKKDNLKINENSDKTKDIEESHDKNLSKISSEQPRSFTEMILDDKNEPITLFDFKLSFENPELPKGSLYKTINENTFEMNLVQITEDNVMTDIDGLLYFRSLCYTQITFTKSEIDTIQNEFYQASNSFYEWYNPKVEEAPFFFEEGIYTSFIEPYKFAGWFQNYIQETFVVLPHPFFKLINYLNPFYLKFSTILEENIYTLGSRNQNEFFKRKIPGFSQENKQDQKNRFYNLSNNDFYKSFDKEKWPGYSPFPLIYVPGKDSYQRLESVPSKILSNIGNIFKNEILSYYSQVFRFFFIELDIKSCHTSIFYSLCQNLESINIEDLPNQNDLWPSLDNEFVNSYNRYANKEAKTYYEIVSNWTPKIKKSILKAIWYKALNGGDPYMHTQLFSDNHKLLNIEKKQSAPLASHLNKTFLNMKSLKPLAEFQQEVNKHKEIYLASQIEPFSTSTLSKSQQSQQNKNNNVISRAGMSRLLSSCEISLIFILLFCINLVPTTGKLIPISYEKDGLLLMGLEKNGGYNFSDYEETIIQINEKFNHYAKAFMNGEFFISAKKVWFSNMVKND